jgi:aspartate-semialdehyde dehydrogenase
MSERRVGVAGATGALGKEILAVLEIAPWRPESVVPLASERTTVPFVEYRGKQLAVDDLAFEAIEDLDLLFLAVPTDVAREVGERAIAEGVLVVDCTGAFAADEDVPLVSPWVNPELLGEPPPVGMIALPTAESALLGPALAALARAGIHGEVEATLMVPASIRGRSGIDELSKQVVALFSGGTPPRKAFPDGLAFDLLPAIGPVGPEGWTEREQRVTVELQRMLGAEIPIHVTVVGVPVFSGMTANVTIRTPRGSSPDLLERILTDAGLVAPEAPGARFLPRPRRVEGKPFAHVGRIRQTEQGIHLWLGLDNLRGTATAAVAVAAALLRHR